MQGEAQGGKPPPLDQLVHCTILYEKYHMLQPQEIKPAWVNNAKLVHKFIVLYRM